MYNFSNLKIPNQSILLYKKMPVPINQLVQVQNVMILIIIIGLL